ncbi:AMP-binding protein [Rhizobium sp. CRIBSB]|nr:AMP-binding protein [Rhizobium sp. CRIBSB]
MKTTADLYERCAQQGPDRLAFLFGSESRTYGQYLARIRQLGSAIEQTGIGRQQTVGIFGANSISHIEATGAAEYGASIPALFNFRLTAPELAALLEQTSPVVLFFDAAFSATVEKAVQGHDNIRRFVCIGDGGPDWATRFEDFLQEGSPEGPTRRPEASDVGTLFFTGGTTGAPRGVPWLHSTLVLVGHRFCPQIEDVSLLQVSPLFHTGGRCPVIAAMWAGGLTVIESGFDPVRWMEYVSTHRINWTFMVPAMMQAVIDHPDLSRYDLSSLSYVMAASTSIPPLLLSRAVAVLGPVFYVAYGSTEGGYVSRSRRSQTRADGTPEMTQRLASVGQVLPWADVVLVGDDDQPVPVGEVGEICVRNWVFQQYWNDPEATAAALWRGEYVRTGDMGRFDEERYLFLVDRKKDMIISGGENIYCREVEVALEQHPALQTVTVIGLPDEKWGETVMALVIARQGMTVTAGEVIDFSQTCLARYKCPRRVEFVSAFPMTSAGKIDKVALRLTYALPSTAVGT